MPENTPAGPNVAEIMRLTVGPEFDYYHEQMLGLPPEKFAVIKVGGATVRDELDRLADDLAALSKMGLYPVVVHGAGPQINENLESRGITPKKQDGIRITDEPTLQSVTHGLNEVNDTIMQALHNRGVAATQIKSGVFEASVKDEGAFGRVGVVTNIHKQAIDQAIGERSIPIVSCIGSDSSGRQLNINGDTASSALAADRQPFKYIALSDVPGVKDEFGQVIGVLNDDGSADELIEKGTISEGMIPKVREGFELLSKLDKDSSIVITSPQQLLKELFTYRGAGTLLRHGDSIVELPSKDAVDEQQVKQLIEHSFGKELSNDYFEQLPDDAEIFMTDREYIGLAIVFPGEDNGDHRQPAYMDKLVVRPEATGYGIGDEIIQKVYEKHPEGIYWRVRKDNKSLDWYKSKGLGEEIGSNEEWVFFGYGINHDVDKQLFAGRAALHPITVFPKSSSQSN